MKLFALSDLHLSGSVDKPMDIFGARWKNHTELIRAYWTETVGRDDVVLIGGDISWALTLRDAVPDLRWIDALPGSRKILLRGNHDFWWTTMQKLRRTCKENGLHTLDFLRNDAAEAAGFYLCGTRGWILPSDDAATAEDRKIFEREAVRYELSLKALQALRREHGEKISLALMHYPPLSERGEGSAIAEATARAGIALCLFGHIHHDVPYYTSSPVVDGVRYVLTSADHLRFCPLLVGEDGVLRYDGEELLGKPLSGGVED